MDVYFVRERKQVRKGPWGERETAKTPDWGSSEMTYKKQHTDDAQTTVVRAPRVELASK
jgi:hypothetical protein